MINPLTIGVCDGFKPNARLTVSEWADEYRILTSESSAESGKWRTSRTPYLREIMDEMSPTSKTQQVKVIKGTQLGFSSIADNIAMCYLDYYPCPILYILPTETLAKGTSKRRITPSLKAIPRLAKKIIGGKSKDDVGETYSKAVAGGNLTFGWSQSTASFRSFSARVVILDDVDGFGSFGEGDVMELGKARADAFSNKKIYINSTPTIENYSNIEDEFKDSDQREYEMPCPECKELMIFSWDYMHYVVNEKGHIEGDVKCACPNCGTLIPEYKKTDMMREGVWIPRNVGHKHRGYKLTSFYSPLGWLSWTEIASEFVKAHAKLLKGNDKLMQVWQNTRNARTWAVKLDGVEVTNANDRVEDYGCEVPNEVYILTAGIDTQDDRFEIEVLGYGKNGETWSIDYKVISGDPQFKETQDALDMYLNRSWSRADGTTMKIIGAGIDTGGHRTKAMYKYCKDRFSKKIFPLKGANTKTAPVVNKTLSDMVDTKINLVSVGVTVLKDDFYSNLEISDVGVNFCHFPKKDVYNNKYFKMLTAEKRDEKGDYIKVRARNEALDCRVYNLATLAILQVDVDLLPTPVLHIGTPNKTKNNGIDIGNTIEPSDYLDDY